MLTFSSLKYTEYTILHGYKSIYVDVSYNKHEYYIRSILLITQNKR